MKVPPERGQIDAGLPYAQRAVATEHNCWECAETLSILQNLARASHVPGDDHAHAKPTID